MFARHTGMTEIEIKYCFQNLVARAARTFLFQNCNGVMNFQQLERVKSDEHDSDARWIGMKFGRLVVDEDKNT